jgi:hypothetical protein
MTRALVVLLGAPALVLALVYGFQRFLIYLPSGSVPGVSAVLPDGEEVRFTTSDGLRLSGWFLPAASAHPGPAVAAGTKRFLLVEDAGHNDPALFVGDELMREVHRFLGEVARAAPEE